MAKQRIDITYEDASEEDCFRYDYVTVVDGHKYCLAASTLGNEASGQEATKRAKELFGEDILIFFA